jgi:hypothetical protein
MIRIANRPAESRDLLLSGGVMLSGIADRIVSQSHTFSRPLDRPTLSNHHIPHQEYFRLRCPIPAARKLILEVGRPVTSYQLLERVS